jgi:hypothetical protein
MGAPTSEVSYISATTRRGDHEIHKGHVVAWGGGGGDRAFNRDPSVFHLNTVSTELRRLQARGIYMNTELYKINLEIKPLHLCNVILSHLVVHTVNVIVKTYSRFCQQAARCRSVLQTRSGRQ